MRGRRSRLLVGAILALVSLVLVGCQDDSSPPVYHPGGPYYRTLDSTGDRIVVRGPDDEPVAKLRRRHHKYKIYGADFAPMGWVSWSSAGARDSKPSQITLRRLGEAGTVSFHSTAKDVYELPAHIRIERTNTGWAVYDRQGTLRGVVERTDEQRWRLRRDYRDGSSWVVETSERQGRVVVEETSGDVVLRVRGEQMKPLEMLAFVLDGLDALERAAVGAWLTQARPRKPDVLEQPAK